MSMSKIVISETNDEYLLRIPAWQKERARGIDGRRWDPERVCWVYPRNMRTYNALVAEFGDDITPSSVFSPPDVLQGQATVDQFTEAKEDGIGEIHEDIKGLNRNLARLTELLNDRDRTISKLEGIVSDQDKEIRSLRVRVESHGTNAKSDPYEEIVAIALHCLGDDPVFADRIRDLTIDSHLPLAVSRIIENHLRRVLHNDEGSFYDLLRDIDDSQMLEQSSIDIAHTIRKQRNFVAHRDESEDLRTTIARGVFCLFGAVLLLPNLPES